MTHLIKHDDKFYDDEDIEELLRLRAERLRFYHADGTFEALASPEEVTKRRVECAKRIAELEDQNLVLAKENNDLKAKLQDIHDAVFNALRP